jgi:hypothetical protein
MQVQMQEQMEQQMQQQMEQQMEQQMQADPSPGSFRVATPARHVLSTEQRNEYATFGYCHCESWFTPDEIGLLRSAIESDPEMASQEITVPDAAGLDTRLALWMQLGDDTCSMFARSASLVRAAAELMGDVEPYHSHSKVSNKQNSHPFFLDQRERSLDTWID